ncbi:MAG: UDP-N-acetylmuramate dehydrogenase [Crocinitomicaceae bacterium]|nr:UDP-N-acetylmuramate dehydrogenase [Crocinitomicaceae bacterium]
MSLSFEKNKELRHFTTFGISTKSSLYIPFSSIEELSEIIQSNEYLTSKSMVLGGGSNVLFTKDFEGVVLHNQLKGISEVGRGDDYVLIEFGSGEVWHDSVLYAVENGYGGIENLSLIPGSVGAAPMQNIGAYGVELKDVFHSLNALEISTGEIKTFYNEECNFGYRESVFKRELKNQFIIVSVVLRLTTQNHNLNTSYGAINAKLLELGLEPSLSNISRAVIDIRRSKLPDPNDIGNSGSFFKNPVVEVKKFEELQGRFPEIPNYPAPSRKIKLAAGWLIEKAGWKGKRFEDYGVHNNQALVLVNYGNAKGAQVYSLSQDILEDVESKFGIILEREVNII